MNLDSRQAEAKLKIPKYGPNSIELKRSLGLFDATMIIVGNIIGIGIFTTTGLVADALPNPKMILFVWILGGLLTLCGALTYAELGAMLPMAGGEYVYLREAYGPFWAFLSGWTYFFVTNPGSIAAMSLGACAYLKPFWPSLLGHRLVELPILGFHWTLTTDQLAAVGIVLVFSTINYLGVKQGSRAQNLLTIAKLASILAICGLGLVVGKGDWGHFSSPASAESNVWQGNFSLAMIAVFFAYTGWFASTYVASEIHRPERNIPYSVIGGTLIVIAIYFLMNVAYLFAVSVNDLRGVINVGEMATTALFGQQAAKFLSIVILISILGAVNSVILTAPRIYYAMARDGMFFRKAAEIHPTFRTPSTSIILQAIWTCLLAISGSFSQLLTYTVVAMICFSIMTGAAIFKLRVSRPDLPRPYKTFGFPWVPAIFVLSYCLILGNIAFSQVREAIVGLAIVSLGAPVYFYWRRATTNYQGVRQ
ncbi:MAG: amino acid permease [Terriglobia bacterium]